MGCSVLSHNLWPSEKSLSSRNNLLKKVTDRGLYLEIYTCYEANFCGIRNRVVDFIMMYRSRDIDLHRLPQISESKEIFFSKNNFFLISHTIWNLGYAMQEKSKVLIQQFKNDIIKHLERIRNFWKNFLSEFFFLEWNRQQNSECRKN